MSPNDFVDERSRKDALNAASRTDFYVFVRRAFNQVYPGKEFRSSPHVDLLCAWLMATSRGEIIRATINMPPRTLKSFIVSVCWVAWELGHHPGLEFMVVSHDQRLARKLADDTRQLMESDWYRDLFPATRIRTDFSSVNQFKTTRGGGRSAQTTEMGVTGKGADRLIFDDANDAESARSPTLRAKVNQTVDTAFLSRLNSQSQSRVIVLGQRLHQDDLTGHLGSKGSYKSLVVPLIAPDDVTYKVGDFEWHRPAGDVLDPESNTPEVVERLKRENSAFDFAAQYQQNPIPPDGQLVDIEWFPQVSEPPKRARQVVLSFDTAQSIGENASYSACLVFKTDLQDHYIVDAWRGRVEFKDLEKVAVAMFEKYHPDAILIENAAHGAALISVLSDRDITAVAIPAPSSSKVDRLNSHLVKLRTGLVKICGGIGEIDALLRELQEFPNGRSDDWVDALTHYLTWVASFRGGHSPSVGGIWIRHRGGRVVDPQPKKPHPQRNPKAPRRR